MNVIKFKKEKKKRKNSVELSNPKENLHQFLCLTFTSIHFFSTYIYIYIYIYIYNLTSIHIYLFDYYHISKIMEAIFFFFFWGLSSTQNWYESYHQFLNKYVGPFHCCRIVIHINSFFPPDLDPLIKYDLYIIWNYFTLFF